MSIKIVLASQNKKKIVELRTLLCEFIPDIEILSLAEVGIEGDIVEDGTTFIENARKKAMEIAEICGCAALADDSGICVDALGGAPGVFSARFAGEHGNDEKNNDLLLEKLSGTENRGAHYTAAIVIAYPDGHTVETEGYLYGTIGYERIGHGGFGYDPLFFPEGSSRTLAEYTAEEKNAISHRANALASMLALLEDEK